MSQQMGIGHVALLQRLHPRRKDWSSLIGCPGLHMATSADILYDVRVAEVRTQTTRIYLGLRLSVYLPHLTFTACLSARMKEVIASDLARKLDSLDGFQQQAREHLGFGIEH